MKRLSWACRWWMRFGCWGEWGFAVLGEGVCAFCERGMLDEG